jgi:hypothetical protein
MYLSILHHWQNDAAAADHGRRDRVAKKPATMCSARGPRS